MSRFPPRRRRVRHDIIMEILKLAKRGIRKTKLMYEAKISFDQAERYLNALEKANFITQESGVWKTTQKGSHVIEACEICLRLTKEVP